MAVPTKCPHSGQVASVAAVHSLGGGADDEVPEGRLRRWVFGGLQGRQKPLALDAVPLPSRQLMVRFIHEHRDDYGVEPICTQVPIAPCTYYEHKSPQAESHQVAASSEARRVAERADLSDLGGQFQGVRSAPGAPQGHCGWPAAR